MIHSFPQSVFCWLCTHGAIQHVPLSSRYWHMDPDVWIDSGSVLFGKTIGRGVFFHQRAHNVWFSVFVVLAEVDTQCLDPLIYYELEDILILSFLFHLLVGTFLKRAVSHIYYVVNHWSNLYKKEKVNICIFLSFTNFQDNKLVSNNTLLKFTLSHLLPLGASPSCF